jgi:hypothetical protein
MMKKILFLFMAAALVTASQAIVVDNFSFEQPDQGKIKGWNGEGVGGTPAVDIPGWASDIAVADSGVESDWPGSTEGVYSGFLMGGDPSAWNLTDYVIQAGDVLTLLVDARDNWTDGGLADFTMSLYYDVGGIRNTVASVTLVDISQTWTTYSLTFAADDVPASIGSQIGIELKNIDTPAGGSWMGMDNVRLVPEPTTMALLGLGALGLLRRRK